MGDPRYGFICEFIRTKDRAVLKTFIVDKPDRDSAAAHVRKLFSHLEDANFKFSLRRVEII